MISEYLANRLGFELNDKVIVYFLRDKDNARPRLVAFDIVGIYNSGFQEFDKQFLMADLRQIQRLNKWEDYQIGQFELMVSDFDDIQQTGVQKFMKISVHFSRLQALSINILQFLNGLPCLMSTSL